METNPVERTKKQTKLNNWTRGLEDEDEVIKMAS